MIIFTNIFKNEMMQGYNCPIYNADRTYLFQEVSKKCFVFSDLNNQEKFIYSLTNEYKLLLAQFVCTAWSTRRKLL